jgi:hypothetical protein
MMFWRFWRSLIAGILRNRQIRVPGRPGQTRLGVRPDRDDRDGRAKAGPNSQPAVFQKGY